MNQLHGGCFVSGKTGDSIVKNFYKIAAESSGYNLTSEELAVYDKVLKAFVQKSDDANEGRTAFADEIEAEDLAAEQKKLQGSGCTCVLS